MREHTIAAEFTCHQFVVPSIAATHRSRLLARCFFPLSTLRGSPYALRREPPAVASRRPPYVAHLAPSAV